MPGGCCLCIGGNLAIQIEDVVGGSGKYQVTTSIVSS